MKKIFVLFTISILVTSGAGYAYTLNLQTGNNMFSIPLNVTESTIQMFQGCNVNISPSHYNPITQQYVNVSSILPGVGYFVNLRSPCSINLVGNDVSISDFPQLSPGWNQIGALSSSVQFSSINGGCTVLGGPYKYNIATGNYDSVSSLEPGLGYFVNVQSYCKLGPKCSDGSTYAGECAVTDSYKPEWCDSTGNWVANQCGSSRHNCPCPGGQSCNSTTGSCYVSTTAQFQINVDMSRTIGANKLQMGTQTDFGNTLLFSSSSTFQNTMKAANIQVVRVFLDHIGYNNGYSNQPCRSWNSATKTGTFYWTDLDNWVNAVFNIGATPLIVIGYAGSNPGISHLPSNMSVNATTLLPNPNDYAAYVKAIVQHFKDKGYPWNQTRYYEIVNEPFAYYQPWSWSNPPDPAKLGYLMALYNASYNAMKSINPSLSIADDDDAKQAVLDYAINNHVNLDRIDFHNYDSTNGIINQSSPSYVNDLTVFKDSERDYYTNGYPYTRSVQNAATYLSGTGRSIPLWNTESNMNAQSTTGTDVRLVMMNGTMWDALKIRTEILDGVSVDIHFTASGDSSFEQSKQPFRGYGFGMTDSHNSYKPWYPYWLYYMVFNNLKVGDNLYNSSSSSPNIKTLAWLDGSTKNILIIHSSTATDTVQVTGFSGTLSYSKIDNSISFLNSAIQTGTIVASSVITLNGYTVMLLQTTSTPSCSCGSWTNSACGAGGCTNQRQQTRTSTPTGCTPCPDGLGLSRCVADSSCVVTSDLVAYYKLDEGSGTIAYDSSPLKNNGTIYNNPTWVTGESGKALKFDGTNYVETPDSSSLGLTSQVTIEAWVNPSSIAAWNRIVAKSYTTNSNPYTMYGLLFDNANHIRFEIASGGAHLAVNGKTAIQLNTWTFVAGTYDGTTIKVYVNGALDNSTPQTGPIDTDSMPLSIARSGYGANYLNGTIDEIKIWNRALSASEILNENNSIQQCTCGTWMNGACGAGGCTNQRQQTRTSTPTGCTPCPDGLGLSRCVADSSCVVTSDLVGYWKFDEGSGAKAFDSSSYGNSGTLGNAAAGTQPTWLSGSSCISGSCLSFDGTNDFVNVSDSNSLDVSNITIAAWIYPHSWGAAGGDYGRIVNKYGAYLFYLVNEAGKNTSRFYYWNLTNAVGQPAANLYSIQLNKWQYITVTYDGQYVTFYVNGISQGQFPGSAIGPIMKNNNNLYIGNNASLDRSFNGAIDELKIWNRALSASEIRNEYNSSQQCSCGAWTNASCNSGGCTNQMQQTRTCTPSGCTPTDGLGLSRCVADSTCGTTSGPIAYWKFDEGTGTRASDSSGNGNNGVLYNSPIWTTGKIGNALKFNGVNNYVNVSGASLSGFTAFTASFWIRPEESLQPGRRQTILNKFNNVNGSRGWLIDTPSYGGGLGFFASPDGSNYSQWIVNFTPTIGSWYHVAVVWQANQLPIFYINGQPVSTTGEGPYIISQIYNNVGVPLLIGESQYATGRVFNGTLDEIKIWNRALSASEIRNEYNSGAPVQQCSDGTPAMSAGVNYLSSGYQYSLTQSQMTHDFQLFKQNNITLIYIDPRWDIIETSEGTYDDAYLGRIKSLINNASQYNIQVGIAFFTRTTSSSSTIPSWVSPQRWSTILTDSTTRQAWVNMLGHMANYLKDVPVYSWIVLDEPYISPDSINMPADQAITLCVDSWTQAKNAIRQYSSAPFGGPRFGCNPNGASAFIEDFKQDSRLYSLLDFISINYYANWDGGGCNETKVGLEIQTIKSNGKQVYIGGFGENTSDDTMQANAFDNALNFLSQNKVSGAMAWFWSSNGLLPGSSSGNWDICKDSSGTPRSAFYKLGSICSSTTCTCSAWTNGACEAGSCAANQRQQTRTCSPSGCGATSQCVADSSCVATYTPAQIMSAISPYMISQYQVGNGYSPSQNWQSKTHNIYIYKLPVTPAVYVFTSSGAIDCDGGSSSICLADTQGQSATSWEPAGRPVDASVIPGYVLPQTPADTGYFDYANNNIQLGESGYIIYNNIATPTSFFDERGCYSSPCASPDAGDDGYGFDIGEMSYASCIALGQSTATCDPNTGGIDSGVTYLVFTTSANALPSSTQPTVSSIKSVSNAALTQMMTQLA